MMMMIILTFPLIQIYLSTFQRDAKIGDTAPLTHVNIADNSASFSDAKKKKKKRNIQFILSCRGIARGGVL